MPATRSVFCGAHGGVALGVQAGVQASVLTGCCATSISCSNCCDACPSAQGTVLARRTACNTCPWNTCPAPSPRLLHTEGQGAGGHGGADRLEGGASLGQRGPHVLHHLGSASGRHRLANRSKERAGGSCAVAGVRERGEGLSLRDQGGRAAGEMRAGPCTRQHSSRHTAVCMCHYRWFRGWRARCRA